MRLIEKKVKVNPETFAPELLVTVLLPLELMNTNIKLGEDTIHTKRLVINLSTFSSLLHCLVNLELNDERTN